MEADGRRGDTGLTLRQVKDIAAEVGIDPAKVESAALGVQAEGLGRPRGPLGLRATTRFEVEAEGEVDPQRYAELIRVIRGALGRKGVATEELPAILLAAHELSRIVSGRAARVSERFLGSILVAVGFQMGLTGILDFLLAAGV
jgi:hypothetical protein